MKVHAQILIQMKVHAQILIGNLSLETEIAFSARSLGCEPLEDPNNDNTPTSDNSKKTSLKKTNFKAKLVNFLARLQKHYLLYGNSFGPKKKNKKSSDWMHY